MLVTGGVTKISGDLGGNVEHGQTYQFAGIAARNESLSIDTPENARTRRQSARIVYVEPESCQRKTTRAIGPRCRKSAGYFSRVANS